MVFLLGFFFMVYFLELLFVLLFVSIHGFLLLHFHITSFLCFVTIAVVFIFVVVIVFIVIVIIIIIIITIATTVLCVCVCVRTCVRMCTVCCGVFCFVEYTGCSFPFLPGSTIDVDVVLLIICQVKYCVDSFTLLKLREFSVFSSQSFQSFLKLDFSMSRSAATFLWLSLCKILCLSFLRGFSVENKLLFDFPLCILQPS